MSSKITIPLLSSFKHQRKKISALTCYDYTFAKILDQAGVEILLVGDSLGMVIQGHENTLPVTVDQMIYHCQAVRRGSSRSHLVCDMPFMSYHVSFEEALRNAGRLVKEGGAEAVKLEGGAELSDLIIQLGHAGIPVMGHIGLKPTHVHKMGGYKVQGKDQKSERALTCDAKALQEAGVYAIVLEGVPSKLAMKITELLTIPVIGIGSGPHCDGQILVLYDLLGLNPEFKPKFVRRYADLFTAVSEATQRYLHEVVSGDFPSEKESF